MVNFNRRLHALAFCLLFVLGGQSAQAERKQVSIRQADSRFTLTIEKYWSKLGGSEEYFFTLQNNTSEEYELVVDVDLDLACVGGKSFTLGVNRKVQLKPYGTFTPKGDWSHIITSGADNFRDCRLKDGDTYTLLQGVKYTYRSIKILSQTKQPESQPNRTPSTSGFTLTPPNVPVTQANVPPQNPQPAVGSSGGDANFGRARLDPRPQNGTVPNRRLNVPTQPPKPAADSSGSDENSGRARLGPRPHNGTVPNRRSNVAPQNPQSAAGSSNSAENSGRARLGLRPQNGTVPRRALPEKEGGN